MAYLRKEDETVEMDYSLSKVWATIQEVLATLKWNVDLVDDANHKIRAKTTAGPMSFGSLLLIEVIQISENTTRVSVAAETPVTTITAIFDFAQGKRRISNFLAELSKQLTS
jgi:hypothetical protein